MRIEDIRNRLQLIDYMADDDNARPEFTFFWSHKNRETACLSNWHPASFELDGITFTTSEHYMMFEKARMFEDWDSAREILKAINPADAKELGRQVKNFDKEVWDGSSFEVMLNGCIAKFTQNRKIGDILRNTGNSVIVEASPYDSIWGIGVNEMDDRATIPSLWPGLNRLGFVLMATRKIIG